MILTLAIFAFGLLALVAFLPKSHRPPVAQAVAFSVPLAALRSVAPFPVYAPADVPSGWVPNHAATHVPSVGAPTYSFDLGFYITATHGYAAVEQSDAAGFRAAQLGASARQTGAETIAGVRWTDWLDASSHPALVRTVGSSTLVLDGVTDEAHLRTLAASLSLQPAHDVSGAIH